MARDTTEDWKIIGASEPWYGVLSAPQFLSSNITKETQDAFYAQGRDEINWVVDNIKSVNPTFSPNTGLDFGCGLGRLSFAMSKHCLSVSGVDISPGMLSEAENQKVKQGFSSVKFYESIPSDAKFDWINSYIVMQHIVPETGYNIIKRLLSLLSPGGWTSIQVTFGHDHRDISGFYTDANAFQYDGQTVRIMDFKEKPIGQMSMYDYDLNRVLFMFVQSGISELKLVHTDHGGAHGFWIFGKRTAS